MSQPTAQPQPPPQSQLPPQAQQQPQRQEPGQGPPHLHPQQRFALTGASVIGWILYAFIVVTEIVLALGFVLRLFGANTDAAFVDWAYRSLDRAMAPFRGIFNPIELGETSNEVPAVLDTSILFAMLVYGILGWLVSMGLNWVKSRLAKQDRLDWETDQERRRAAAWQAEQQRRQAEQWQQQQVIAEQERQRAEEWHRQQVQLQAEQERRLAEQERQRAELERRQAEERRMAEERQQAAERALPTQQQTLGDPPSSGEQQPPPSR